ncbi:inhibitor of cysteine peptidase [Methylopila jiangsuensis]|uniref:Inhibitor of cysteine peptidase n=1 Tax=Methylopila jiangsuensis TaxID=586230 RepID=A0A9W6JJA6_9HYPH|nr:protease inhibitor I42 family protein [Methylopila jiangsuensis]MDR6287081.1 putative secreted protein [Methylopila jiangsuensis]GLK76568.1 inhibitor of cysteine peptidase [Methylopila jiangsuensis]
MRNAAVSGLLAVAMAVATTGGACATDRIGARAKGVALSEAEAGRTIRLPAGVTSTLRLKTNPSTGYGWEVAQARNLAVKRPFGTVRNSRTSPGLVGAPETALIAITPRVKGPASLRLVYKRPWEKTVDRTLDFAFVAE